MYTSFSRNRMEMRKKESRKKKNYKQNKKFNQNIFKTYHKMEL